MHVAGHVSVLVNESDVSPSVNSAVLNPRTHALRCIHAHVNVYGEAQSIRAHPLFSTLGRTRMLSFTCLARQPLTTTTTTTPAHNYYDDDYGYDDDDGMKGKISDDNSIRVIT